MLLISLTISSSGGKKSPDWIAFANFLVKYFLMADFKVPPHCEITDQAGGKRYTQAHKSWICIYRASEVTAGWNSTNKTLQSTVVFSIVTFVKFHLTNLLFPYFFLFTFKLWKYIFTSTGDLQNTEKIHIVPHYILIYFLSS